MKVHVCESAKILGLSSAEHIAKLLRDAISTRGEAGLLLSTGKSQFETISALIKQDVDWGAVSMFHLDEYIGLSEHHPASFRNYLKQRFSDLVPLKQAFFVDGEGDISSTILALNKAINEHPIDVGVIGIGENAHIAFNDPPADFITQDAFITVELDERCRTQQVGEGWFNSIDDVPRTAITMSVSQIMRCRSIVSPVPYKSKAIAIQRTLQAPQVDALIPATILREHPDWTLYLDLDSALLIRSSNN